MKIIYEDDEKRLMFKDLRIGDIFLTSNNQLMLKIGYLDSSDNVNSVQLQLGDERFYPLADWCPPNLEISRVLPRIKQLII